MIEKLNIYICSKKKVNKYAKFFLLIVENLFRNLKQTIIMASYTPKTGKKSSKLILQ